MKRRRLVSGMRPTGPLHIGHYFGALQAWRELQGEHECFFFVADWHVLTDHAGPLGELHDLTRQMVADWIACGLDPQRATLYVQSSVPEVLELAWMLGSVANVGDLERCPTYKEVAARGKQNPNWALLGYPVLQCADIGIMKGELVPVGEDQVAHLEICRELIRGFNRTYGVSLPEMHPHLTATPRLVGTDGQAKMSKSLGNCIFLSDDPETVERRVRGMFTDPKRVRADIPGTVEGNPVFIYHDLVNQDRVELEDLKTRYRQGRVGDVEVKRRLAYWMNRFLEPICERRAALLARPEELDEWIRHGCARARRVAQATMEELRDVIGPRRC